jgi:hypothetical protein
MNIELEAIPLKKINQSFAVVSEEPVKVRGVIEESIDIVGLSYDFEVDTAVRIKDKWYGI